MLVALPDPSGYGLYALIAILISVAAIPVAISQMTPPPIPQASQNECIHEFHVTCLADATIRKRSLLCPWATPRPI